jgi:predicted MFS family arabinose efflux permease
VAVGERGVVFLVGAVQFVNILDFMMVMPLGPDFAASLGIPTSHLGFIGGAYTAAAAVAGMVGATFLDRFDRRGALGVAMTGLVIGTALGGVATGLLSLIAARVVAGAFGGPATALSLSIVADVVPAERRGKAMGAVMGAFSVASVVGVPIGLEVALRWGWRAPFFAVAGVGALLAAGAVLLLPSLRGHLVERRSPLGDLLAARPAQLSWVLTVVAYMAGFVIIPNLSAYIQRNLAYPRDALGGLYLLGGCCSFLAMRACGRWVDRSGPTVVATAASLAMVLATWIWLVAWRPGWPLWLIFPAFMVVTSVRNVAYNALTSRVPRPEQRARFNAVQSAVQHASAAVAAFVGAAMLTEGDGGVLVGIEEVAAVSIVFTLLMPGLMAAVQRGLGRAVAA